MYDPDMDGINHLNIYSGARTELGRFLSNFQYQPFTCVDGKFNSIEGYWYWLGTADERLRVFHGLQAKQMGRSLPKVRQLDDFEARIYHACLAKINSNQKMREALTQSQLPFAHYYVFNGRGVDGGKSAWLLVHIWETIRTIIRQGGGI